MALARVDTLSKLLELNDRLQPYAWLACALFAYNTGGKLDGHGKDGSEGAFYYDQDGAPVLLVRGGIWPTITSVYRSAAKQAQLYEARATNPYPVNRPGDSAHQYGLAWDSDVPDKHMRLWIDVRRYVGWTVPDNDEVHAELPNWRTYVQVG